MVYSGAMLRPSTIDQLEISKNVFRAAQAGILFIILLDLTLDLVFPSVHALAYIVDGVNLIGWSFWGVRVLNPRILRIQVLGWQAFIFGLVFAVDPVMDVFIKESFNPLYTVYNLLGTITLLGGSGLILNMVSLSGLLIVVIILLMGFFRYYEPGLISPMFILMIIMGLYALVISSFHRALRNLFQKLDAEKNLALESVAALQKAQTQIRTQEKLATLGSLSAGIAHELRNPLNFVVNFSESSIEMIDELQVLQSKPGDHQECSYLLKELRQNQEEILAQGHQGNKIITSILHQARTGTSLRSLENINVLLEEAVNLAERSQKVHTWKDQPQVVLNLAPDLPLLMVARGDLSRVFLNLLVNAYHAISNVTGRQGHKPRITITTQTKGSLVAVMVQDNGTGFPPEMAETLFTPFYTTKPPGEGTGLGLPICREVIQSYGGTIRAAGAQGQGAVFTILLPSNQGETQ